MANLIIEKLLESGVKAVNRPLLDQTPSTMCGNFFLANAASVPLSRDPKTMTREFSLFKSCLTFTIKRGISANK